MQRGNLQDRGQPFSTAPLRPLHSGAVCVLCGASRTRRGPVKGIAGHREALQPARRQPAASHHPTHASQATARGGDARHDGRLASAEASDAIGRLEHEHLLLIARNDVAYLPNALYKQLQARFIARNIQGNLLE